MSGQIVFPVRNMFAWILNFPFSVVGQSEQNEKWLSKLMQMKDIQMMYNLLIWIIWGYNSSSRTNRKIVIEQIEIIEQNVQLIGPLILLFLLKNYNIVSFIMIPRLSIYSILPITSKIRKLDLQVSHKMFTLAC